MNKQFAAGIIVLATVGMFTVTIPTAQQSGAKGPDLVNLRNAAPITTSGDNTYIVWWTNRTGNDEVLFRASTDGDATFAVQIMGQHLDHY